MSESRQNDGDCDDWILTSRLEGVESVEGEHKKVKDKRINVRTDTLEGIKVMKLESWE